MRLHRLSLRDYKGVAHRDLLFPDAGIVVVEGPNEVGKTTMLDALDLLLEHKDSSKRAQIRAAQPVGRDVGPSVEVDLSAGPYRFVYRKQWLRQCATELTIRAPARVHLVGDEAHERVCAILAETTDLQLWKALRLLQAQPLLQDGLGGSTALATALDRAGGTAADAGPAGETLLTAAEAAYQRFFTARTGQPTGEFRAAVERVAAAEAAVEAARAAVREVADDVDQHERTQAALRDTRRALQEAQERQASREQELAGVRGVTETLLAARGRRDELTVALEREVERQTERTAAAEQLQTRVTALAAAQDALTAAQARLGPAQAQLHDATAAHDRAQQIAASARARLEHLSAARTRARHRADLAVLTQRLRAVDEARAQLTRVRAGLQRHLVDTTRLRALEEASQAVDLAVAAHTAGSAAVRICAIGAARTLVISDDPDSAVPSASLLLAEGQTWDSPIGAPMSVQVPGVLDIELEPESGAGGRAAAVAHARDTLDRMLAEAGCDSLAQARAAHDERHELQAAAAGLEARVRALLDGGTRDDLSARVDTLAVTGAVTGDDEHPGEDELAQARAAEESARLEAEGLRLRRERLDAEVDTIRSDSTRAEGVAETVREQVRDLQERLAGARARLSDEALREAVERARARLARAHQAVADAHDRLAGQDLAALEALRDAADAEATALAASLRELDDQLIRLQARLDQAGGQGRAETYDAACTDLERARRVHERLHRHAQAARLLRDTLTVRSRAAKQAYVRPFADAVDRLGRIVYGPTFEVEVCEDLTIEARIVDGERIPFAALSTGAKEQLAILTRLACAALVDGAHGVPVVIDDALGYSDPDKLRRVCAAVGRLHDQAQVVLLTCTPGRYAAIPQAHVVRL